MIDQIKQKYSCCNNICHEEHLTNFYINDISNGKCITSTSVINSTCLIENTDNAKIDFIAVDSCLICDNSIEKCDVLVTKKETIWFIELKEISQEGSREQFKKRKKNYRKKATSQIASTINDFKNKGIDFSGYNVAGLICFPPYSPLSIPSNIPTTTAQIRILEFQKACGFTELNEGNFISL
ncbi:hypothetical protein [Tenacibaculum piscium]|uniref:NERD domain-containing protein n=1 Tax=Tenacibaculum piscium TaxID=1458515 RepID=A0A2H1YJN3_9FLAO|nr:hypothetical protein [Tenacibaculum piscium]MBE7629499.1 hypothetical protein [Tenacibaculum piscium]MBE7671370.1 hypothetical protein [Tenacibaculum piscium]SOS75705.1 hypothetical protein TNO020_70010 [Tenacibaculum piscium]